MTRIVLINGAPGSGKSTIGRLLAQRTPMALSLDLDLIKHSFGQWDVDATAAGYQARRLGLAMADEHLGTGYDVIIGQYLARTEFIEQIEDLARRKESAFFEFVLIVDERTLVSRLDQRAVQLDRREHEVNARLQTASDAPKLIMSIERLRAHRPSAIPVDASGTAAETVTLLLRHLSAEG